MTRDAHSPRSERQRDSADRLNVVFDERRDDESVTPPEPAEDATPDKDASDVEDESDVHAASDVEDASAQDPTAENETSEEGGEDSIESAAEAIAAHPIFDLPPPEKTVTVNADKERAPLSERFVAGLKQTPAALRGFFLSRGFSQALGVVGESLITLGVIVMLFLGWQLWINDVIIFNESSAVAEKNIQKWTTTKTSTPTASGDSAAPVDYGPAPVMAAVAENEVFGNLYIPRFGNDYVKVVANGVSPDGTLNRGYFGRYPDSAWPGDSGNFAVAVHRAGHGSPFRSAPLLRTGDKIVLQTSQGYYEYTVRNTEYVLPTAVEVVNAIPGGSTEAVAGQSVLTITTCNPELGNNERLITYSVLTGWRPADAGPPESIAKMVAP